MPWEVPQAPWQRLHGGPYEGKMFHGRSKRSGWSGFGRTNIWIFVATPTLVAA